MSEDWSAYRLVVIKGIEKIEAELDRLKQNCVDKSEKDRLEAELEDLTSEVERIKEALSDEKLDGVNQKWINRALLLLYGASGGSLADFLLNFFKASR